MDAHKVTIEAEGNAVSALAQTVPWRAGLVTAGPASCSPLPAVTDFAALASRTPELPNPSCIRRACTQVGLVRAAAHRTQSTAVCPSGVRYAVAHNAQRDALGLTTNRNPENMC